MSAYHKIFIDDEKKKLEAAVAWSKWEGSTSALKLCSRNGVIIFRT